MASWPREFAVTSGWRELRYVCPSRSEGTLDYVYFTNVVGVLTRTPE